MKLSKSLEKTFKIDKQFLEESALPIVTVSASYKEDLKGLHGFPEDESIKDIVFSRAHYSMALAVGIEAWGKVIDHKKAWIVDPTNYVSNKDWQRIVFTEQIGKTLARYQFLKTLKDLFDKFGRSSKLPILPSITPPLLHLTENISCPIMSLHIAAGNVLAMQGKLVIQVVTDPHVRNEYLDNIEKPNFMLCVFDEKTRTEVLEKAAIMGKKVDPDRIVITGPPIDPRIIDERNKKQPWRDGPLNLCLSTGGLGTNKQEIKTALRKILPLLRKRPRPINLCLYSATHKDIYQMGLDLAKQEHIKTEIVSDFQSANYFAKKRHTHLDDAKFAIIYHPQLVDVNEILIKHVFPWADGFITKPSGDMAYDAVAAGCFLLTLGEWGPWEENIKDIFVSKEIARVAEVSDIDKQLEVLMDSQGKNRSWVEKAMTNAATINHHFLDGTENLVKLAKECEKRKKQK